MSPPTATFRNRLHIDDILDIAGKEQLKGFRWADGICSAINPYLSLDRRITILNTGDEIADLIKSLPSHVQIRLSVVLVDVETGELTASRQTLDGFPALTEELIEGAAATPAGNDQVNDDSTTRVGYERYEHETNPLPRTIQEAEGRPPPNSTIMMMIAAVLVAIALIMTFTVSKIAKETGGKAESTTLEVVLRVLGDVFKSAAQTNPDGNGNTGDSTSDDSSSTSSDTSGNEEPVNPRYQDDSQSTDGPRYGQ